MYYAKKTAIITNDRVKLSAIWFLNSKALWPQQTSLKCQAFILRGEASAQNGKLGTPEASVGVYLFLQQGTSVVGLLVSRRGEI